LDFGRVTVGPRKSLCLSEGQKNLPESVLYADKTVTRRNSKPFLLIGEIGG
jgi:hypothetical protein